MYHLDAVVIFDDWFDLSGRSTLMDPILQKLLISRYAFSGLYSDPDWPSRE
jgi:hypothetical protein